MRTGFTIYAIAFARFLPLRRLISLQSNLIKGCTRVIHERRFTGDHTHDNALYRLTCLNLSAFARLQLDEMANELLKLIFQDRRPLIVAGVNPDPVMDVLFSENVISSDDYCNLRKVLVPEDRCHDMLERLHSSAHPQAFIHLRLALLDEYSWIVDEIDKKLPSLRSQLQQLRRTYSIDGNRLP